MMKVNPKLFPGTFVERDGKMVVSRFGDLRNQRMELLSPEMGKIEGWADVGAGKIRSSPEFEISVRHPNGDIK